MGLTSLTLGIIGIFVPLLPTTPFIILAAALFARSSEKLHHWLVNHPVFGKIILWYVVDREVPMHAKIISIVLLWILMLYSIFKITSERWQIQFVLLFIAVGISLHILSYKTKK